ncbi:MAG: sulfurtransferase TusA family protein [Deltaproteobacteria bacterium]|nr:sulfurtransferase TusA family protein [Deltaproteobacteria bacterium]
MFTQTIDARGLKCPQPILKITATAIKMKAGDIIEIMADCSTFENDIKDWCQRSKKMLMWIKEEAGAKKAQIQF